MTKDITKFRKAIKESLTPDLNKDIEAILREFRTEVLELGGVGTIANSQVLEQATQAILEVMDRVRIDELKRIAKLMPKERRTGWKNDVIAIGRVEIEDRLANLERDKE